MFTALQAIGVSSATQLMPLGTVHIEMDLLNNKDWGEQRFVYKKIFDAGVATAVGSPVGDLSAAGGGTVTPDFSDTVAVSIRGDGGGFSTIAVALNVVAYGWVQTGGLNRYAAKCTGAVAQNVMCVWTDDNTFAAFTDPGNEELIFGYALVAAASGFVAVGGFRKFA